MSSVASKPLLLVTSAGGNIGGDAVRVLLKAGHRVRALVRTLDARAAALEALGADVVKCDLFNESDVSAAVAGVARVLYIPPFSPRALEGAKIMATAARAARVTFIVSLSQWLANADSPSAMSRAHAAIDALFQSLAPAGVAATVVNPGFFADVPYLSTLEYAALLGLFPFPADAASRNAPPSVADIARVAARILADGPTRHAGRSYRPTGPELLSVRDMVAILSRVLGRSVRHVAIPPFLLRKALLSDGYDEETAANFGVYLREHSSGAFAVCAPTSVVADVTGVPAESFESVARRLAAAPRFQRSFSNVAGAWARFMVLPFARGLDVDAYNRRVGHRAPPRPLLALESEAWRAAHEAQH